MSEFISSDFLNNEVPQTLALVFTLDSFFLLSMLDLGLVIYCVICAWIIQIWNNIMIYKDVCILLYV